jgi:hypothetical protein
MGSLLRARPALIGVQATRTHQAQTLMCLPLEAHLTTPAAWPRLAAAGRLVVCAANPFSKKSNGLR